MEKAEKDVAIAEAVGGLANYMVDLATASSKLKSAATDEHEAVLTFGEASAIVTSLKLLAEGCLADRPGD